MTDDRALLEAAAKAAGLHHSGWDEEDQAITAWFDDPRDTLEGGAWGDWNPLVDDGQALRLAVKLCIDIEHDPLENCVHAICGIEAREWADYGDDRVAATRRAIVRAAASLSRGERMEG